MSQPNDTVSIRLRNREYQVKCPAEKIAELQEAANYLDVKMCDLSEGSTNPNFWDRLVVIAALNIAHEFLSLKKEKNYYIDNMNKKIIDLQNKIEQALAE